MRVSIAAPIRVVSYFDVFFAAFAPLRESYSTEKSVHAKVRRRKDTQSGIGGTRIT